VLRQLAAEPQNFELRLYCTRVSEAELAGASGQLGLPILRGRSAMIEFDLDDLDAPWRVLRSRDCGTTTFSRAVQRSCSLCLSTAGSPLLVTGLTRTPWWRRAERDRWTSACQP
jgi:hypothetical protein